MVIFQASMQGASKQAGAICVSTTHGVGAPFQSHVRSSWVGQMVVNHHDHLEPLSASSTGRDWSARPHSRELFAGLRRPRLAVPVTPNPL